MNYYYYYYYYYYYSVYELLCNLFIFVHILSPTDNERSRHG